MNDIYPVQSVEHAWQQAYEILAYTRWRLCRAIATLHGYLADGGRSLHPDKTQIGKLAKGVDWLGGCFNPQGVGIAPRSQQYRTPIPAALFEQALRQGHSEAKCQARVRRYRRKEERMFLMVKLYAGRLGYPSFLSRGKGNPARTKHRTPNSFSSVWGQWNYAWLDTGIRNPASILVSCVWAFALLFMTIWTPPCLSITFYPDNTMLLAPEDTTFIDSTIIYDSESGTPGLLDIDAHGSNVGPSLFMTHRVQTGIRASSSQLSANGFALLKQYVNRYVGTKVPCNASSPSNACEIASSNNVTMIYVHVCMVSTTPSGFKDRYLANPCVYFKVIDRPTPPVTPTMCSSAVTSVEFGLIPEHAQEITRTASVTIECNKPTTATVVTNNGYLFMDPASDASIRFTDPMPIVVHHSQLPINVALLKGPSQPGRYSWSIPVTVNYE